VKRHDFAGCVAFLVVAAIGLLVAVVVRLIG
jgi:FtsH-binding integral membrane protein